MLRLFTPPFLASVTLIALGCVAHAAPGNGSSARHSTTGQSGSTTSYKPSTATSTRVVISAGNTTPKVVISAGNTTPKVVTYAGNTPPKVVTYAGNKPLSNTAKYVPTTNTQGNSPKFVSKLSIPSKVKMPGKNVTGFVSTKQYAGNHGVKFKRGVFYRGLNHRHWSGRHFHPRWRTWFWYCPSTCGWYYWCAEKSSYMPSNVISSYPPEVGDQQEEGATPRESTPPDGEEVPKVSGEEAPDVPNPEGIE